MFTQYIQENYFGLGLAVNLFLLVHECESSNFPKIKFLILEFIVLIN